MQLRTGDPEEIGGYPLEARLGAGGMGAVFLARTASGRPIAIKLIHQQFAGDEEFRIRFRQEVSAARRVSGVFTAAVVDADVESHHPWMATAYITGPTLAQRIGADGSLGGTELRMLAIGLAEALREIHRAGVVHRDLKPSNVVLSPEGPRVIDFGISRAADHQTLTMTGRVIGTPPYMSPEQLQAPREVGPESDVFSLGTLLVYAATGQGPFDADSPYMTAYQVVHEAPALGRVPDALREIVEPCLAKEPQKRPSADELLRQLRGLPEDLGQSASQGSAGPDTDTRLLSARAKEFAGPKEPADPDHPGKATPGHTREGDSFVGRTLRRRWRTAVACAAAVAAIAGGVAVLQAGTGSPQGQDNTPAGDRRTVSASTARLPEGFRPWQVTVRGGRNIPDEMRCAARSESVFCGGGGVIATRIRVADGTRVWNRPNPGVPTSDMHFVGVAGDTVLGYRSQDDGGGTEVVALTAGDGEEVWSAPLGSDATVLVGRPNEAVLQGFSVYSADASKSRLVARDATTGKTAWRTPFPAGSTCTPLVAGKGVYAVCAARSEADAVEVTRKTFHTVDAATGRLGKAMGVTGDVLPLGAADGSLVLLEVHRTGAEIDGFSKVKRLDPRTGRVTSAALPTRYTGAVPGLAGGRVYFSGNAGLITAVDPATGKKVWARQTSVEDASGPVLSGGVLYFSSTSGRVAALDADDGRVLWTSDPQADGGLGGFATTGRVVFSGRALIGAANGNTLFGFDVRKPPRTE
ncbi:serine/threonine-protein kinase [Streptomyces sporangiiformans]|uniref:Serine/threonine protein kinase n=1 Tax=Streptomyces sporangiiformans TaxID=2315329 RepID=A0A505DL13_9ACTN|nr:serine/threonine-protein kinase [Streptomyces sporangiiformans]TPQ20796.1 serine/threonine protein kinase [Streptomyces sporangiiformans]